jgi:16S rRNA (uracil1498-N3)-methyltransferase
MREHNDDLTYPGGVARLYVDVPLARGATLALDEGQSHYLAHVLRARPGQRVRLFNGADGEWSATIAAVAKRGVTLEVEGATRLQQGVPDLWLLMAPVKKAPLDYIVQKATELGVARILPVMTRRTIVERINTDRMLANAVEAAEQSERLSVPVIDPPQPLDRALAGWDPARPLIFCDEAGDARPLAEAISDGAATRWALLTGPEGGFAPEERAQLRGLPYVIPVTLGPRIMRADTAAVAALAVWQALKGDWRSGK